MRLGENSKRVLVLIIATGVSIIPYLWLPLLGPYSFASGLTEKAGLGLIFLVPLVLTLLIISFRVIGLVLFSLRSVRSGLINLLVVSLSYLASVLVLLPFRVQTQYDSVPVSLSYLPPFIILLLYYSFRNKSKFLS